jgi:peptidylprolyl isomerase
MKSLAKCILTVTLVLILSSCATKPAKKPPITADVLAASTPADWRPLDPENTLYMELASGRVVIELAPAFAPNHVANVKALAREHYFDGLAIIRVQDNYVAQWADPNAEKPDLARTIQHAQKTLRAEFDRPLDPKLPFTPLPDRDVYAPEVGFSEGFPVARDPATGKMWLVHCYGMVGAGRDNSPDSGGGAELYVVIGHAPRHLDRNVTLLGRVVQGMELISALPRGTGALGFYEKPEQDVPIKSIRVAADVPAAERSNLEILRTDTATFRNLIEAKRNRREEWFQYQAATWKLGMCRFQFVKNLFDFVSRGDAEFAEKNKKCIHAVGLGSAGVRARRLRRLAEGIKFENHFSISPFPLCTAMFRNHSFPRGFLMWSHAAS